MVVEKKTMKRKEGSSSAEIYQFHQSYSYPVYITLSPEFSADQLKLMQDQLSDLGFMTLGKDSLWSERPYFRMLQFIPPNPVVAKKLGQPNLRDGLVEDLITEPHQINYRIQGLCMMSYLKSRPEWQATCLLPFHQKAFRLMIIRYLSLSLAPLGVIGFWGKELGDNIFLVQKNKEAEGQCFFIDVFQQHLLQSKKITKLQKILEIYRIEKLSRSDEKNKLKMKTEELLSFLSSHCTYFDNHGLVLPIRQMISFLPQIAQGWKISQQRLDLNANLT